MDWSYIAGLFDSKGWASITFKQKGPYLIVTPSITWVASTRIGESIKNFLEREKVRVSTCKKGDFYCVSVHSWDGCHRVCSYIEDHVTEKKHTVELLMQAIDLHHKRSWLPRREGRLFSKEDLKEFDRIRHEIHESTRKGPKKLREYTFV